MVKYRAAVLGCGAIFSRHLAALQANSTEYDFIGYYDPNENIQAKLKHDLPKQIAYQNEDEIYADSSVNCVIILTPSYLHYTQAKKAILAHKNVIIEKPASFKPEQLVELENLAHQNNVDIFCILQVRLNHSVKLVKQVIAEGLLGEIRSSSLVQRWQRPINYFTGWRGTYQQCGGVLNEFGIHYLDIMQFILGVPKVKAAQFFNTKYINSEVADSAYALLDFGKFGGTMEICLTAEPHNIEVSLIIMGSRGYLKMGGKSLDQITTVEFLDDADTAKYEKICENVLGHKIDNQVSIGACPHHPELYKQIIQNPDSFRLKQTRNVIELIKQINELDK